MKFSKYVFICCFLLGSFANAQIMDSTDAIQDTVSLSDSAVTTLSDSTLQDSTGMVDSLVQKVDTLEIQYYQSLPGKNTSLKNSDFYFSDYRYTGEIFGQTTLGYIRNTGFIGYPEEMLLYGVGYNGISFLENGLFINDRALNTLDLHTVLSESIERIDIAPLARGFLFGTINNPVSVNFHDIDFVTATPYSRIRYYEGPNSEGYLDVRFNMMLSKKLNVQVDVANQNVEDGFVNTGNSTWNGNVRAKYFATNTLNIIGSYSYMYQDISINGGIDYESIKQDFSPNEYEEILYSDIDAPVVYPATYQKNLQQKFVLSAIGSPFEANRTELSFYYQQSKNEYRQYEDSVDTYENKIMADRLYEVFGAKLSQNWNVSPFSLDVSAIYEHLHTIATVPYQDNGSILAVSGVLTTDVFGGAIKPSAFAKLTSTEGRVYSGIGADLEVMVDDNISVYGGVSSFDRRPYLLPQSENSRYSLAEAEVRYKDETMFVGLSVYYKNVLDENYSSYSELPYINGYQTLSEVYSYDQNSIGAALTYNSTFGFMGLPFVHFETQTAFNRAQIEGTDKNSMPMVHGVYGIYYRDAVFDSNLVTKAGIVVRGATEQAFYQHDYYNHRVFHDPTEENIEGYFQIDLMLTGIIQDAAIIYFIWENLLDRQYYITPYHPMLPMNIRFGISWELWN